MQVVPGEILENKMASIEQVCYIALMNEAQPIVPQETGVPSPEIVITDAVKEAIFEDDSVLAARHLDRKIEAAVNEPNYDPKSLELLRFQRSLVGMNPEEAFHTTHSFVRSNPEYADFADNGDGRLPSLHFAVQQAFIVSDSANSERWDILGINPHEYFSDSAGAYSRIQAIERTWREARNAREALIEAQKVMNTSLQAINDSAAFRKD